MKDVLSAITIGDTRGTNHHKEDQTERVRHEMALATFHLFRGVEPFFTTHFGRFDALTVNDTDTWFWLASCLDTNIATQQRINAFKCAIISPFSIVIPDMIPRWEIRR